MLPLQIPWDAVEAIATAGTGLLTVGSLLLGFSILRNDRKKEERAQASLVTAWFVDQPRGQGGEICPAVVAVRNGSNLPIHMVMLYMDEDSDRQNFDTYYVGSVQPGVTTTIQTRVLVVSAMPPDAVDFTDANGRRWRRTEQGALHRMTRSRGVYVLRSVWRTIKHPVRLALWVFPSRMRDEPTGTRDLRDDYFVSQAARLCKTSTHEVISCVEKYEAGDRMTWRQKRVIRALIGPWRTEPIGREDLLQKVFDSNR